MTPEKRKKIKALMDSPASTENEKEICRKLLKDNPEPDPPVNPVDPFAGQKSEGARWYEDAIKTARTQQSGAFWNRAAQAGAHQDAARQQASVNKVEEKLQEAAERQRAAWDNLKKQVFGGAVGSPSYRAQQQAHNDFLNELARIMAVDFKKGEK